MLVEIHLAVPGDAALFDRLAPEIFDRPLRPEALAEVLACPRHHLAFARMGSSLVGIGLGVHHLLPDGPAELWIADLRVTPMMRRQGVGRRLLQKLLHRAAVLDCHEARVVARGPSARAFYAREGGQPDRHVAELFRFVLTHDRGQG